MSEPKEFWVAKGTSCFADNLKDWVDEDEDPKHICDFYDLVSDSDTIVDGIHVIEKSAYDDLKKQNDELKAQLEIATKALKSCLPWVKARSEVEKSMAYIDRGKIYEALAKIEGEK